jgi:hypothetical protein
MLQTFKAIEAPTPNGVTELPTLRLPRLPSVALQRLQRLQARVDGATEVAQVAVNAHNAVRDAYQSAFVAACEDVDIAIPSGPHEADIDWATGEVRFIPKHD